MEKTGLPNGEGIKRGKGENEQAEKIFFTGGFVKNPLFMKLVASSFPDKKIFVSDISNGTSLGTALVTLNALMPQKVINPNLGLTEVII